MLGQWRQDVRHAVRALLRAPAFAAVAVLTLSLGMAATISLFSVVSAVLLRPLSYPSADRLVHLEGQAASRYGMNMPDLLAIGERARVLESVVAYQGWSYIGRDDDGVRVRRGAASVSSNYFDVLGARPAIGRFFLPEEDRAGHAPVLVISHGVWQREYGGASDVVGRTVTVDSTTYTIVGVAPAGLMDPLTRVLRWNEPEAWRVHPPSFDVGAADAGWIGFWGFGRLRPGASVATAQREVDGVLRATYPHATGEPVITVSTFRDSLVRNIRPTLIALFAAVIAVLLIACANVANLLLSRSTDRARELAVRASMGAPLRRLVAQLFTENLVLSALAAAAGLFVALASLRVLGVVFAEQLPPGTTLGADWRVVVFTVALATATALLFGLAPAAQLTRTDLTATLRESGRGAVGARRATLLRHSLVVVETALAVLLISGAGLLFRTFWNLQRLEPGFDPAPVVTVPLYLLSEDFPTNEQQTGALERVQALLAAQPAVDVVAAISDIPMSGAVNSTNILPPAGGERVSTLVRTIAGDYFAALQIPVLAGRTFEDTDRPGAAEVAIINRTAAARHFGDGDPIDRTLVVRGVERRIVGVVEDVVEFTLTGERQPVLYTPYAQETQSWMRSPINLLVRGSASPEALGRAIREAARAVGTGTGTLRALASYVERDIAGPRVRAVLVVAFAALALALAGLGIASVIAYGVSQRIPEIGIRMALGASTGRIARLVAGESARLAAAGVVIGLLGALWANRLIARFLYGVPAMDPITLAVAAGTLLLIGVIAAGGPAWRAARVNPAATLRGN